MLCATYSLEKVSWASESHPPVKATGTAVTFCRHCWSNSSLTKWHEHAVRKFWDAGNVVELRQALLDEIEGGGDVEAAAEALSAAQPARNAGRSQQLKVHESF